MLELKLILLMLMLVAIVDFTVYMLTILFMHGYNIIGNSSTKGLLLGL